MKAVNLYLLTRNRDMDICSEYENVVSERKKKLRVKEHEYKSLCSLVDVLLKNNVNLTELDGFHFSFQIKQISKEFDLLKVRKDKKVINIELKWLMIGEERIERQLVRNRYYLRHISDHIFSYTYVADENKFYTLNENNLTECSIVDLVDSLIDFEEYDDNLSDLFNVKDYLISPLNMPEKFLNRQYFLTDAQEQIKQKILTDIKRKDRIKFWGLTGSAGTGKTLLLYDLARELTSVGKVCVIHCGTLYYGHTILSETIRNLTIFEAMTINQIILSHYDYILIDETQRINENSMMNIIEIIQKNDMAGIFSYDRFQVISKLEEKNQIADKLKSLACFQEEKLKDRIRTNEEMAAFIKSLLNLNEMPNKMFEYNGINIVCANSSEETSNIVRYYREKKGYTFIEYTKSVYSLNVTDQYHGDVNTHKVIGQEFDNVLIVMDKNFNYSDRGHLTVCELPNSNYLFYKLFFQGISRVRENLCIVVNDNPELLKKITNIKYRSIQ